VGNNLGVAYALEHLAALAKVERQADRAARLYGAAAALRDRIRSPLSPADHAAYYDRDLAEVRACLGETAFRAAWSAGAALTPEEAAALAVAE
jgi:hypothetical protein